MGDAMHSLAGPEVDDLTDALDNEGKKFATATYYCSHLNKAVDIILSDKKRLREVEQENAELKRKAAEQGAAQ